MVQVNLKQLVGRLNDTGRRTLEAAAGFCLSRTNYNVEIEHWLLKILESSNADVAAVFRQFGVDISRVTTDLTRVVDRFKTGNARSPALSLNVVDLMREAWLIASVDYGERAVRSSHLLCALMADEALARVANAASKEFEKIPLDALRKDLGAIVASTDEAGQVLEAGAAGYAAYQSASASPGMGEAPRPGGPSRTPSLDQFTIDLTQRARQGQIDPVLGRDAEIRQIIDILTRRRQNNPILTGEAGVGKTAVVEGFAARIVAGDVPPSLQKVSIRTLDLGLLQAGAGVRGEFENRLKSVISEVKASPTPVILFIDEAHTLIGAGGGAGQGDAANLLKPALARGELRTIAATTWSEYKEYFEKDAALTRRFQVVKVDEPEVHTAIAMMRGLAATLEKHHGVRVLNEAVEDAVRLSSRYISGRQLPDKSVSLLDTTCARIGLSQSSTPPAIEDCRRRTEQLDVAIEILEREARTGAEHSQRIAELEEQKRVCQAELQQLTARWEEEKQLACAIREHLAGLEAAHTARGKDAEGVCRGELDTDVEALRSQLRDAESNLKRLQGEHPLVFPYVTAQAIAETVSSWTGIPLGRMVADEIRTVLNLKELMEQSIVGQSHALDRIAKSIRTSRASLRDPRTPIGVFLLAGPSGVGKTETAITLANLLYGGEQNMTVINMSEFKEEHKVSLLMGSPPGYVGYGKGGVLTEAVRRKPYSVVLLDEMEKSHPGVQEIFYQVFDKGMMNDSEGRDIDFKNTVILMTTNAGSDPIKKMCADPDTVPEPDAFVSAVYQELVKIFKPAFLGRLEIIPFYPLRDDVMRQIIRLKLDKIASRVREHYKATFHYASELVETVACRCTEVDTGARNVDHILTRTLLPELSAEFLARVAEGLTINRVEVGVQADGSFQYHVE